jgi:exonuclease III
MILLTLNIRGVGGTLKLASMRRVFRKVNPDVILLQETLVDEEKARRFMVTLVPNWYICAVDSVGNSGGLLAAWDWKNYALAPYLCEGGIMLKGSSF